MRDLNIFFKYLSSTKIVNQHNLFREYPRYDELIKRYKTEYEKSLSKPIENFKISKAQVFTIPYELIGGVTFELAISIDKLYNLINDINSKEIIKNSKEYNKEFTLKKIGQDEDIMDFEFNSEFLNIILNEQNIDKIYAKECINNNENIICGDFSGITLKRVPYIILDGNHRCYSKIKSGRKFINGVLVGRNTWINCLLTDTDKMFIKIFSNINVILSYRKGINNREYVDKHLYDI